LYTHANPINNFDPIGRDIYFCERPIKSEVPYIGSVLMFLESVTLIGMHGYLYLSNTQMTGTYGTEIYTTSSNTFNNGTTFSWHPYKWLENSFSADKYPARVWVNDPRDKALFESSFMLGNTFRISSDLKKEQDLANNINKWIHTNNVGWEAYAEVGNEGNSGSF
jgi:hypothetical protein